MVEGDDSEMGAVYDRVADDVVRDVGDCVAVINPEQTINMKGAAIKMRQPHATGLV